MPHTLSDQRNDHEIVTVLERYDSYIVEQARYYIPRDQIAREILDIEIDELAQQTRIKLWNALRTRDIRDVRAYIKTIVRNTRTDMLRKDSHTSSLVLDDDGELPQGKPVGVGQEMPDPAHTLEEAEAVAYFTDRAIWSVLSLPPRQRIAIAFRLKSQIADVLPLAEALKEHGLNVQAADWPLDKKELQRLRASLAVARKKLEYALM